MTAEHLTDDAALHLLELLRDYARDAVERDGKYDHRMRVDELAGDLIDSLPRERVRIIPGLAILRPDSFDPVVRDPDAWAAVAADAKASEPEWNR